MITYSIRGHDGARARHVTVRVGRRLDVILERKEMYRCLPRHSTAVFISVFVSDGGGISKIPDTPAKLIGNC